MGGQRKASGFRYFRERDKKVNLFGVFRPDNFCLTYESDGNINADFLIRSINDCCRYVKKPTVLVLDNVAEVHRADGKMDGAGFVYFLFAEVFAASEHRGNLLAES